MATAKALAASELESVDLPSLKSVQYFDYLDFTDSVGRRFVDEIEFDAADQDPRFEMRAGKCGFIDPEFDVEAALSRHSEAYAQQIYEKMKKVLWVG